MSSLPTARAMLLLASVACSCRSTPPSIPYDGVVFLDENRNGIRDPEEKGLGNAVLFFETEQVSITNDAGKFGLELPSTGGILWVRGQDGLDPGPFWIYVDGTEDVGVLELPVRPATVTGPFSFVVGSDTHAGIDRMSATDQIVGLVQAAGVEPKPHFVTITGDITQGNEPEHFDAVFAAIEEIDIPYVPVPGNHDWYDGGAAYRERFGPPSYAFDSGGVHFVVLNDADTLENRTAFLDADRALVADDRPVFVLMHAPPREDLRLALEDREIDVLLTGHMHSNRVLIHDTFVEYNTQPLVMGGIDLTPGGFRIFRVDDAGQVSVEHRTTVNTNVLAVVAPGPGQVFAPCTAQVIVAAKFELAISELIAEVETVGEVPLEYVGGWNYRSKPLKTLCDAGRYSVTVAAESSDGSQETASAFIEIGPLSTSPQIDDWPMFQGSATHAGAVPHRVPYPLQTEWVAAVGSNIHGGSPVVAGERVFVSVSDFGSGLRGGVVALDAKSGETLWEHRVGFSVRNAPAVAGETVVFVSNDGTVHGVDVATGDSLWTYELAPQIPTVQRSIYSSPTVLDGVVYVGGRHEFAAIDPKTGTVLWNVEPAEDFGDLASHASPAIGGDEVLIPFNRRDGLFAFERQTGNQLWHTGPDLVQGVHASPVIDGDVVYLVNETTRLTAVNMIDSQEVWGLTLEADTFGWGYLAASTPVLQAAMLLVGTQRQGLHAVDTVSRSKAWTFQPDPSLIRASHYHGEIPAVTASPVCTGDLVWLPGQDGWLRALDLATGKELWSVFLGVPMASSIAVAGEVLIVAGYDGSVRSLRSVQ